MRILVCGGRDFHDQEMFDREMGKIKLDTTGYLIIHGGAKGADAMAQAWAEKWRVPSLAFPADWDTHGKSAGPIRNRQMLKEGKPDLVMAFPGGAGTLDMVGVALKAGVYVHLCQRASPFYG